MSTSVVLTALLGLFSLSQASLPDCKELITPLTLEDDNKSIMGKWIFLEGVADHLLYTNILKTVNSSWMEFGQSTLANTVTFSQGNMLKEKCEFSTINATVKDSTFYASVNDTVVEGKFLPSCPDCLTMNIISQFKNETIHSLYLFKRESKRTESDTDTYWKQAECLGFKRETQYSYDGVTELCHVVKEGSSDQKPSLDKSNA
ncbi:saxitoxin and tetrodotoxin-binding 1-like protein [Labeo rohita]|uniref:Saxitoxin and tetrodotoxin-binding 1-like protein n=1 Tax=Labeo rohita TaxID=84645 RepID=A0A498M5Q0_LABRO|nr:saxitoxin and tetrodotoxin-binding protein 1-like [Labeo rohita]RXN12547.1 saxitoxin and tetrodotoxin-binding 1-like protein [Labeo rohita]